MASAEHTLGLPRSADASDLRPVRGRGPSSRYLEHGTAQTSMPRSWRLPLWWPSRRCSRVGGSAGVGERAHVVRPAGDGLVPAGPRGRARRDDLGGEPLRRGDRARRTGRLAVPDRPGVGRRIPTTSCGAPTERCGSPSTTGTGSDGSPPTESSPSSSCAISRCPTGITVGPDGALWFAQRGVSAIGRITLDGEITEWPTITPRAAPLSITTGPDGALWFTLTNANAIGRITVDGVMTEFPLPTPDARSAVDHPGSGRRPVVHRARLEHDRPHDRRRRDHRRTPCRLAGAGLNGITVGLDGALWFTEGMRRRRRADQPPVERSPRSPSARGPCRPASRAGPTERSGSARPGTNHVGRLEPVGRRPKRPPRTRPPLS